MGSRSRSGLEDLLEVVGGMDVELRKKSGMEGVETLNKEGGWKERVKWAKKFLELSPKSSSEQKFQPTD